MRKQDLSEEGFLKSLRRGIAKGYTATQKGGSIGPDSLEKGVERFFTDVGKEEPAKDKKDQEISKLKKDLEQSKKQQAAKDTKMDKKSKVKEGLADLAGRAEADHEVQMARADLYKIAKYAIKLHDMLKGVSEAQGLEGWQQAKITKAADYISSVFHNLDYEMKFGEQSNMADTEMPVGEGKYKSDAQRKAIYANKDKKMKEDSYKAGLAKRLEEKAKSKAQQKFMGMVYATKKGEPAASPEVAKAAKGMSKKAAKDYASTKHKGKPEHVKKD